MAIKDIFQQGLDAGWQVQAGQQVPANSTIEADVVIVGSGAGGATSAELLSQAGLNVLIIEEGALHTSKDFKMLESQAYSNLYQEGLGRTTQDGAISIMQGRAVGGSTLVNWASCFRTPEATLQHWAQEWEVKDLSAEQLLPWFAEREQRLNIEIAPFAPNANNEVIRQGCQAKGWSWNFIPRNVKGCANLGYCGLGCPINAKQSMLVTTIPSCLENNGQLLYSTQVVKLQHNGKQVQRLECRAMNAAHTAPTTHTFYVQAKHYILAGGAINTPAILLRSHAPDPYSLCGKRSFLHIANFSIAHYQQPIMPFYGAPQTTYTDQFQWDDGVTGHMSYKLEAAPLQPAFGASLLTGHGVQHAKLMHNLPHTNALHSLLRDGFHPQSTGGTVTLRSDGSPSLDYPITHYVWDGLRRAFLSMAQIQLASGAHSVLPLHADAHLVHTETEAKQLIEQLPMQAYRLRLGSAHAMGGCAMSENIQRGLVNSQGLHHHLSNLSVHDASVFPTSIGANPQLSIYAISAKFTDQLIQHLAT